MSEEQKTTHQIIYNYETNKVRTIPIEKTPNSNFVKVFEGTFYECNALRGKLTSDFRTESERWRA